MAFIYYVTQIQFDYGAVQLLKQECERVGITRPLVVTDPGVRAAGVLQKALDALAGLPVAVFDQTPSNPTEAAVRAAVQVYRANRCDGLIAVGGGSSIDCAKGVAIAATHEGPLTHYATIEGGSARITDQAVPLIAVPTTSGTGSEVARGAILIVDDHRKLGFHSWHLVPRTAICDPELTLGLPPRLTAATGMDAVAHCMETFMSSAFNPPADGIALDGLQRGWAHIERATRDGSDREARFNLMSASMQGAMAFQKGLGCVHSLSHSLGGVDPRLHHGTLNAMFLPAVVAFNAQADSVRTENRLQRMAHAMGLASGTDIPEAIRDMNARLGLPSGWRRWGSSATGMTGSSRARWPTTATRPILAWPAATNTRSCWPARCSRRGPRPRAAALTRLRPTLPACAPGYLPGRCSFANAPAMAVLAGAACCRGRWPRAAPS